MPTPNTNFSSGAVYTAAQANNFPRGVMSIIQKTTSTTITSNTLVITAPTFTAVANRYYKVTWFEPVLYNNASGYTVMGLYSNGVIIKESFMDNRVANQPYTFTTSWTGTFSAGNVVITGRATSTSVSFTNNSSATSGAYLLVEDLGPI
jgi:hypothetical protein